MKQRQNRKRSWIVLTILFMIGLSSVVSAQAVRQRSEIDTQHKWNLADMFPNDESWEGSYNILEKNIGRFDAFKGHLAESSGKLLQCLKLRDSLGLISDNLQVYAGLSLDQDNRASKYQEMSDRISGLNSRFGNAVSFIDPEILTVDNDKLTGFLKADAGLSAYSFYLNDLIRTKAHILSDKEEALLALAGPVTGAPSRIFSMADEADISFGTIKDENGKDVQLSRERYSRFLESSDRRLRHDAAQLYNETYLKYINTLGAALGSSVKKDWFLAQARKYPTCLESSLDANNIPTSVYNNLTAAANANLAPLHKWASLRKRILGVDTLRTYDLYATLLKEKPREYTWDEAKEVVLKGLTPMGPAYLGEFKKGLTSGWIDVYETQGKGSGAYNWGTYSSHPYILLNYNGTLDHVFTLAHEMGHAMHAFYTNRSEPYQYSNHSLFTAEVASTCNEAILMKYLLDNTTDKKEKMILLNQYIEQIIGTFYTQIMFSEFEQAIHGRVEQGQAVSADFFRKTYRGIYEKYWGPELKIDSIYDLGGMRISHFYRQFYVYQYATCYAAAQMLSQKILDKEPKALETYAKFLSTGSSKHPVDILKEAGVDMTTPEPVARTIKLFGQLVDQMEDLLNKQ